MIKSICLWACAILFSSLVESFASDRLNKRWCIHYLPQVECDISGVCNQECNVYISCPGGLLGDDCEYMHVAKHPTETGKNFKHTSFKEFNSSEFKRSTLTAKTWLLQKNKTNAGWGQDIPRAVVALGLCDKYLFQNSTPENLQIAKESQLSLAMKLLGNDTDPISLTDLSLHINALIASCVNPRRFPGSNLVHILRQRADMEQNELSLPAYLTLCLVNETSSTDVQKVRALFSNIRVKDRLDVQALGLLILTCISQNPKYSDLKDEINSISQNIISQRLGNELEDTYTIALVAQALNAARFNDEAWNRTGLLNTLVKERQKEDGSFGDLLATYYALPILCGKSLISLKEFQCDTVKEFTKMDASNYEQDKLVTYSLIFGNSGETFETMQLKVSNETTFFEIMKLAANINSNFRFKCNMRQDSVVVYSIHNKPNDVERGLSWFAYINSNHNSTWVPYTKNIMELVPKDSEHVAFWFRNLM